MSKIIVHSNLYMPAPLNLGFPAPLNYFYPPAYQINPLIFPNNQNMAPA